MAQLLIDVRERVRFCDICRNVAEQHTCSICRGSRRSPTSICVFGKVKHEVAIKRSRELRELYDVVEGVVSPIDGIGPPTFVPSNPEPQSVVLLQGRWEVSGLGDIRAVFGNCLKFGDISFAASKHEFNNLSGLHLTVSALGILRSTILWVSNGVIRGLIVRQVRAGSIIALLNNGALSVGLLKAAKIFYFGDSRLVPDLKTLAVLAARHPIRTTGLVRWDPSQRGVAS
jgi:hypothetical protein